MSNFFTRNASSLGYKEGDWFRLLVSKSDVKRGDVVELVHDDDSDLPKFRKVTDPISGTLDQFGFYERFHNLEYVSKGMDELTPTLMDSEKLLNTLRLIVTEGVTERIWFEYFALNHIVIHVNEDSIHCENVNDLYEKVKICIQYVNLLD